MTLAEQYEHFAQVGIFNQKRDELIKKIVSEGHFRNGSWIHESLVFSDASVYGFSACQKRPIVTFFHK